MYVCIILTLSVYYMCVLSCPRRKDLSKLKQCRLFLNLFFLNKSMQNFGKLKGKNKQKKSILCFLLVMVPLEALTTKKI